MTTQPPQPPALSFQHGDINSRPLVIALEMAVPLHIFELYDPAGLEPWMIEDIRTFAHTLGAKGDLLLYRSNKKGETATLFNELARAIALLSFFPGGITIFGLHFDGLAILETRYSKEDITAFINTTWQRYQQAQVEQVPVYCRLPTGELIGPFDARTWLEKLPEQQVDQLCHDLRRHMVDISRLSYHKGLLDDLLTQTSILMESSEELVDPQRRAQANLLHIHRQEELAFLIDVSTCLQWLWLHRHRFWNA